MSTAASDPQDRREGRSSASSPTPSRNKPKALLRLLIAELRVNGKTDIQPTYRIVATNPAATAGVCATSGKVETAGIEPAQCSRRLSALHA